MYGYEAEEKLEKEGLRMAKSWESGWTWTFVDEYGLRITWWVTEK